MTFTSYAQNGEDVVLWRALKDVEDGFYIDVGACDPSELSVTRAFYDRGWRGLNVEPVRHYYELLVEARPRDVTLNVAVTARSGIAPFKVISGTGLSTTVDAVAAEAASKGWRVESLDVPALSLADICASAATGEIHFLKIDVEGGERAVLEGADFERFRPWIVVVEATVPLSTVRNEHLWEDILLEARYERAFFDGINLYYVARERAELIAALAMPPNALDDYVPVRLLDAEQRAAALAAEAEARQARIASAEAALDALRQQAEAAQAEAAAGASAQAAEIAALAAAAASRQQELEAAQAALAAERQHREAVQRQMAQQLDAQNAAAARLEAALADLQARFEHQTSSDGRRLAFATRRLAQSRRRAMALDDRLHAYSEVLGDWLSLPRPEAAGDDAPGASAEFAALLRSRLERHRDAVLALRDRCEALDAQCADLREHRDKILASRSWRVSAPMRKVMTAVRIARRQPEQFVPLMRNNFLKLQQPHPLPLLSVRLRDKVLEGSPASDGGGPPGDLALIGPAPESSDRRGQLAALIRRDTARRRLALP